jgi:uncharacterized Ntn-hydrolase superfamily protein
MTYSIVAFDPATGELGVAVQSRWFDVGAIVTWAAPGVGAVATQSFAEPSYGPRGLEGMAAGASPQDVLAGLLAEDPDREVRQVGMVDASGRATAFTGARCVTAAGHLALDGFSVQANMMERATVWPAMADAYRSSGGALADRLLAALRAAEAEGGDVRGRQSAALLVVPATGPAWTTRYDVHVDDHRAPLDELARLLQVARAYEAFGRGNEAAMAGELTVAAAAMEEAHGLAPDDDQITLWTAFVVAATGRTADGRRLFATARAAEPRSAEHLRRFLAAGLLPPQAAALLDALEAVDLPG